MCRLITTFPFVSHEVLDAICCSSMNLNPITTLPRENRNITLKLASHSKKSLSLQYVRHKTKQHTLMHTSGEPLTLAGFCNLRWVTSRTIHMIRPLSESNTDDAPVLVTAKKNKLWLPPITTQTLCSSLDFPHFCSLRYVTLRLGGRQKFSPERAG